jgi:hypothetical protein
MHLFHLLLNKCRDKPKHVTVCNFKHLLLNHLNAELNPIYHLLALLVHHILHISRIRVNYFLGLVTYNDLFVLLTAGVAGCCCV